jgi:hypothetical protein
MFSGSVRLVSFLGGLAAVGCLAQGTGFTYQGRLLDHGVPANGTYTFRFTLYDTGSNQVAGPLTNASVAVSNGLMTAGLDFGAAVFDGSARWLQIDVSPGASTGAFTTLAPWQPVTPTPYAIFAGTASGLAGGDSNVVAAVGDGRYIGSLTSNGTNTSLWSGNAQLQLTNVPSGSGQALELNAWPSNANSDRFIIGFAPDDFSHGSSITFIGNHGIGPSEMLFVSAGSIAFIPAASQRPGLITGERRIHFGGGSGANGLQYMETLGSSLGLPPNGNVTMSAPWLFRAMYLSNGVWNGVGNAATLSGDAEPAYALIATDTNGSAAFRFYDYFDPATYDQANWGPSKRRLDILLGPSGGLDFRGKLIVERQVDTNNSATYALDFGRSQCIDVKLAASTVTFYTTNATGSATNFEERTFLLRSGTSSRSLRFPGGWSWLSESGTALAPTNLAAGRVLYLKLASAGSGESNILARAVSGVSNGGP